MKYNLWMFVQHQFYTKTIERKPSTRKYNPNRSKNCTPKCGYHYHLSTVKTNNKNN